MHDAKPGENDDRSLSFDVAGRLEAHAGPHDQQPQRRDLSVHMMRAYYNENELYPAQWLENLIAEKLIPPGDVDRRSIVSVRARDLVGYTQCHFFAGIAGWSLALKLAGWPEKRPVWTGSCPCQPFSNAGARKGYDDERHLWPHFKRLIAKGRPSTVFGEQVAAATDWLGLVRGDLEALDYRVGAIPIEAASAGAEHYRDRYWFVADRRIESDGQLEKRGARRMVDTTSFGWGEGWTEYEFRRRGFTAAVASIQGSQYVECSDGKWRRLPPPRVRWLANGLPARVAKLRAFGNAVDPRTAAAFVRAYLECAP